MNTFKFATIECAVVIEITGQAHAENARDPVAGHDSK